MDMLSKYDWIKLENYNVVSDTILFSAPGLPDRAI